MATISSHVLDSITGRSARGIRVVCSRLRGKSDSEPVFDVRANEEGRISVAVDTTADKPADQYELVFFSGDYFVDEGRHHDGGQIVDKVVVRLMLSEPQDRYHVPVLIAPHSYTVWWSG